MNKGYESLQKEIDKLFWKTSEDRNHKKYQEMKSDEEFQFAIKKIGKLVMKLEKLEEENRKNGKRKEK